jgi:hypothetical protein
VDAIEISLGALLVSTVSLLASLVGLSFAAKQSQHAAHATSMATARHFMTESRALWRECEAAVYEEPLNQRRVSVSVSEIMGHFELMATFLADGMAEGRTYALVADTVRDYLGHMSAKGFPPYVQAVLDTDEVCENLRAFCIQRGSQFQNAEAVFEMMKIPKSSL